MTFKTNQTKDKKREIFCNSCKRDTFHKVQASINKKDDDYESDEWFIEKFEIIQCLGCETVSFLSYYVNSIEYEELVKLYPKRSKDNLTLKSYETFPESLEEIYREVIDSYNYNNFILCGAGVRILVEGLCKENGITDENGKKNLKQKIDKLCEKGILTDENTEILHEHRLLGNDAVHELSVPSKEELGLAIKIVESIFEMLYQTPKDREKLKAIRGRK